MPPRPGQACPRCGSQACERTGAGPARGGRQAGAWAAARHIHTFAATVLDRIYLLGGQLDRFDIRVHGLAPLEALVDAGRGALLFGSHLGSFDALRVLSA